ncbi:MAG: hypothetical protein OEZ59_02900 [Deltaproteobacteria bacterium]|nr:hypothetical protein [Deltaproteobacteria bacterium]
MRSTNRLIYYLDRSALPLSSMEHVFSIIMRLTLLLSLALLVLTGELIARAGTLPDLVSLPALRDLHLFFGGLLLMVICWRLFIAAAGLPRFLRRAKAQGWKNIPGQIKTLLGNLSPASTLVWSLILTMVFSGLERFWQFRYGGGYLPWASPLAWAALHRHASFYLYALFIFLALNWSRIKLRDIHGYFFSP